MKRLAIKLIDPAMCNDMLQISSLIRFTFVLLLLRKNPPIWVIYRLLSDNVWFLKSLSQAFEYTPGMRTLFTTYCMAIQFETSSCLNMSLYDPHSSLCSSSRPLCYRTATSAQLVFILPCLQGQVSHLCTYIKVHAWVRMCKNNHFQVYTVFVVLVSQSLQIRSVWGYQECVWSKVGYLYSCCRHSLIQPLKRINHFKLQLDCDTL